MAPLASMFAREASARSRFALPAAAALSRAARSGDLTIGSRLLAALGRPQIKLTGDAFKRQLFGCAQHTRRSFCTHSSSAGKENLYNEFFAEEKDMESDEALWALYHRWCKHHKVQRDHDDMVRRFDEFKYCVHRVHRVNSLGLDIRLGLNKNSDIPLSEKYSSTPMVSDEAHARFKALAKALGGSFTIEFGPPDDDGCVRLISPMPPDD